MEVTTGLHDRECVTESFLDIITTIIRLTIFSSVVRAEYDLQSLKEFSS